MSEMREAMAFHLDGMRADGQEIPLDCRQYDRRRGLTQNRGRAGRVRPRAP